MTAARQQHSSDVNVAIESAHDERNGSVHADEKENAFLELERTVCDPRRAHSSPMFRSGQKQGPVGWNNRTDRRTDVNVIVNIPNRCLTSVDSVQKQVGTAVTVKVRCPDQRPTGRNCRTGSFSEKCPI